MYLGHINRHFLWRAIKQIYWVINFASINETSLMKAKLMTCFKVKSPRWNISVVLWLTLHTHKHTPVHTKVDKRLGKSPLASTKKPSNGKKERELKSLGQSWWIRPMIQCKLFTSRHKHVSQNTTLTLEENKGNFWKGDTSRMIG